MSVMLNHMSSGSALANNDLNELALDVWANFNVYRAFKSWATSRAKAAKAAKAAKVVSKAAKAAMAAKEAMAAEAMAAKAKAEAAEAAAGERKAIKICVAHELLPKLKGAWARRTQKMIIEAVGFTQAMTGSEVARAAARGEETVAAGLEVARVVASAAGSEVASSLVVRVAARWEETVAAGSEVVRAAARAAVSGEDTVSAGSRVARAASRAAGSELARAAVRGGGSGNVSGGSGSGTVVSGGSSPYYRWARPSQLAAQAAVLKERCALRTRGGGAHAIMETEATAGTTAAVTAEATAGTASVVTAEVLAVAGGKGVALSGGAEATAMERGVEMAEAEIVEAAASAVVVEGSGMQIETAASAVVVEGNGMQIETAAASAVMIRSQMQIKIQSPAATVIARRETRLATSGFDFELLDEEDDDEFEPSDEDDDNSEPLLKDTTKHKRVRHGPIGNRTADGKVVRQGANLVFGKLGSTASQLAILSERESSLTEKGKYRAAATIAAEAPVGAVDVGTMPRRETFPEGVAGATLHEAAQAHWRDSNMGKELKQRRTAAAYEKRVGLFNDWATQARYDSFCAWVEVSPGRFELHLIMDDGVPRAPTVASLLEFAFRQAAGDIDKGGRPEYRNGPQYRRVHGKPQGTSQMPEAKRKKQKCSAPSHRCRQPPSCSGSHGSSARASASSL